jgi:hypothetical protein
VSFKIKEQPNVFDDHFLDIIGNEFKFDHVKGLAEWLKNSADAYVCEDISDEDQYIFLRFFQKDGKRNARFECVDFVGMTKRDIDKAFKRWGDPTAASRGTGRRTLGGHGNGGKFYMRQMFKTSQFVTYRDGKLNVFGFNERKRYGYAESYENKSMSATQALDFSGLSGFDIPKCLRDRWSKAGVGFTVVMGESPEKLRNWSKNLEIIARRLRVHPQSRRLVKHKQIFILDGTMQTKLLPEEIVSRPGFEGSHRIDIPSQLEHDGQAIQFRNERYPDAYLTLYTSAEPFSRTGERSSLNSIDILGEVGCIGSYKLNELGYLRYPAQAEFIYGECFCPIMEEPSDDCVRNDREKLVEESEKTKVLLSWIRGQVDELCGKMAEKERSERKRTEIEQSSAFNELLNSWKNKFMSKIFAEVLGGPQSGYEWGGSGSDGDGNRLGRGKGRKGKGRRKNHKGSGDQQKRTPRFPRVLLSGYDVDPLSPQKEPLILNPRHPAVYQREQDVKEGIYWINTTRPLAQRIIDQYTVKSTRWREYLFQRYVDIIVKEALYQKARKEPNLTASIIDSLINDEIIPRVHDAAAQDLESFLFEEAMELPRN